MTSIKSLSLNGFKTIYNLNNIKFENINIFIGANGRSKNAKYRRDKS